MNKIEELENRIKELENHNINNIIKRVKMFEDKVNTQYDINKHISNKFRKVWDCINANHSRIDKLMCIIKGETK